MTYGTIPSVSLYTLVVIAIALVIVGNLLSMLTGVLAYKIKKMRRDRDDD